jgi:S-(hydroxymethyl)glutathione dehydrogenase/alcohol dehydrogenase
MTTRAAVLHKVNRPLRVQELELPPLRPGQILVKLVYSGVCHSQLMEVRGKRGFDRYLPHLLGHEGSGVVMEVGENVEKVSTGDTVVLTWIKGKGAEAGGTTYGLGGGLVNAGPITTFGQYSVVSENRCVRLTENIPLDVAALLGCAVLTGAGIIFNTIRPSRGSSIVIWGVGGIGLSAVMAARIMECAVIIAIDTNDLKLKLAGEFGATHLINVCEEEPLSRIGEIVGQSGVDYAVESAGRAATIEQAFGAVRKNGGLCVFASHPPTGEKISLDPHDLISGKQIRGSWGGESDPDEDIPRLVDLYRQGALPLDKMIAHRYRLDEINDALDDLEKGVVGRLLIALSDL